MYVLFYTVDVCMRVSRNIYRKNNHSHIDNKVTMRNKLKIHLGCRKRSSPFFVNFFLPFVAFDIHLLCLFRIYFPLNLNFSFSLCFLCFTSTFQWLFIYILTFYIFLLFREKIAFWFIHSYPLYRVPLLFICFFAAIHIQWYHLRGSSFEIN